MSNPTVEIDPAVTDRLHRQIRRLLEDKRELGRQLAESERVRGVWFRLLQGAVLQHGHCVGDGFDLHVANARVAEASAARELMVTPCPMTEATLLRLRHPAAADLRQRRPAPPGPSLPALPRR